MKIGIADNTALKFFQDIKEHWEKYHDVQYNIGASENIAQWADIYWVEWWDNNIHYLFNWYKEHPEAHKPKFIVRVIDWDFWVRGVRSQEMVDWVDKFVCIAPHILEGLKKERDDATGKPIEWNNKLTLIRPGVNLEKFTLKTKETDGFQLGMVLGDMWWPKNHMGGLDIFTTLYRQDNRWRLHIRGQHEGGQYWPVMYNHYLESRQIKDVVTLYGPQPNMNEWYENIDILLHPGMKEAFSYATAETMCKGIPVVVNEFLGSRDIWPEELGTKILYQTHFEAVDLINSHHKFSGHRPHEGRRDYIKRLYSNERSFKEADELLKTV